MYFVIQSLTNGETDYSLNDSTGSNNKDLSDSQLKDKALNKKISDLLQSLKDSEERLSYERSEGMKTQEINTKLNHQLKEVNNPSHKSVIVVW